MPISSSRVVLVAETVSTLRARATVVLFGASFPATFLIILDAAAAGTFATTFEASSVSASLRITSEASSSLRAPRLADPEASLFMTSGLMEESNTASVTSSLSSPLTVVVRFE